MNADRRARGLLGGARGKSGGSGILALNDLKRTLVND
jgi:hypothetical protein